MRDAASAARPSSASTSFHVFDFRPLAKVHGTPPMPQWQNAAPPIPCAIGRHTLNTLVSARSGNKPGAADLGRHAMDA
ncbi:hypothetical protein L665_04364 [Ralstonia solanacearum SD54]|nr:hypothetical protein A3768_4956 [Ralstonia solanacearum]ESS49223.1 hypothetical protein L665_04364 [Ralstonia solanacearum SD54]